MGESRDQTGKGAARDRSYPGLPPALQSLNRFLRSATALGTEIAFWRSHAQLSNLEQAAAELQTILLNPHVLDLPEPSRSMALTTFEGMRASVLELKKAVPFRNKVGALRRSLMAAYQQIFILDQLLLAVIARMRMAAPEVRELQPRAGSLLDLEAKREALHVLKAAVPFWKKEEWNVYDYL